MSDDALSIRYVRALVDGVEHRGLPRSRFFQAARWDQQRLFAAEGRVPCSEFAALSELAVEVTSDPALGLHVLEVVQTDSVDVVGHLVESAATVREALESLLRVHKLFGDERRFDLIETNREVTLRYECPRGVSPQARRFLAEFHVAGWLRLLRHFAWDARATKACFEHSETEYGLEYSRLFSGAERFDQPLTGIVFDRALMSVSRKYYDEELYRTVCDLAATRVMRIARRATCAQRVREFLIAHASPRNATMAAAAHAQDLSARSLRRRLTAEGTSYDAVAQEALAVKARRLLSIEQRTIEETAYALGYSDSSAFHRAFKRWTGTTPGSFRIGER